MTRSFRNRTVLVTGAASGLGRALCHALADRGARLAVIDRDGEALTELVHALDERGIRARGEVVDVTDRRAIQDAVARLAETLGPIETVVANAGVTHRRTFASGEGEALRRVMEVNFFGAVHTAEACFDQVVEQRGLFVAISSVAGFAPLVRRTGYAASKHALEGFFGSLRAELHGTGVGVLVVRPAFIATAIRRQSEGPQNDTVGGLATPEAVAEKIVRAAEAGRSTLHVGRVAHLSHWLVRFWPGLYQRLMRRRLDSPVFPIPGRRRDD